MNLPKVPMQTIFQVMTSGKVTMCTMALVAWSAAGYFYFTADTVGFWICLLGSPGATWIAIITLTTKYIVDDTGITVVGKLMPTRRFRWEEITRITCTRIKPFSLFPTEIRYKLQTNAPSPGKFAPYINISTANVKNADQLIRTILGRVPSSTHVDPEVRRYSS